MEPESTRTISREVVLHFGLLFEAPTRNCMDLYSTMRFPKGEIFDTIVIDYGVVKKLFVGCRVVNDIIISYAKVFNRRENIIYFDGLYGYSGELRHMNRFNVTIECDGLDIRSVKTLDAPIYYYREGDSFYKVISGFEAQLVTTDDILLGLCFPESAYFPSEI